MLKVIKYTKKHHEMIKMVHRYSFIIFSVCLGLISLCIAQGRNSNLKRLDLAN
jgi:hypothetical protein